MYFTLQEFLERLIGYEKLCIFNEEENIEDKFEEDDIPKEWLDKIVRDFDYSFGVIWVKI